MRDAQQLSALAFSPRNESGHRLPAALDDARVTVGLPDGPRADHACIAPSRPEVPAVLEWKGRVAWEGAARSLGLHQLPQPFGVERRHVRIVSRRAHIDLCVAGPAEPFVPLGAIRRQVNKVRALRPHDVLVQPVHHRIGALEIARKRSIGVQHNARDGVEVRLARIARHLHILEPVEGESRRIALPRRVAAQGVVICRARLAQVLGHEAAIGMQHLAVAQANARAGRTFDLEPHHAGEVLSQVEDVDAVGRRGDGDRLDLLNGSHWHTGEGLQLRRGREPQFHFTAFNLDLRSRRRIAIFVERRLHVAVVLRPDCRLPLAVVEARFAPARYLLARVITLTHQEVRLLNGARTSGLPGCVRDHRLARAVGILDFELRHQGRRLAVGVPADALGADAGEEAEADITGIPAIRHPSAQRVRPAFHQGGDVISVVVRPLAIITPARREVGVAHARAIQVQLIDAERRRIDCCLAHLPIC